MTKFPVTLRASEEDINLLLILNKIPQYPKHQVKSKFFSLLIRGRAEALYNELVKKGELSETESEVLKLLEGKLNGGI